MWPWSRRRSEADFAAEIEAHITLEIDRLIDEGLTPDEARRAAHRRFGNVTVARERFHDRTPRRWLDDVRQDVRYTIRSLSRSRSFTSVAVLTLAVGIGATTAIFSVVDAVLLKPLPYTNPESLVVVSHSPLAQTPPWAAQAWRDQATSLSDVAGFRELQMGRLNVGTEPLPVDWAEITWNLPSMLGATPAVGRAFVASDAAADATPVVMLSYDLWNSRFDADPSIVGSTLALNGDPVTVVGVLDRSFRFPARASAMPAAALIADTQPDLLRVPQGDGSFSTIGRLAPGVTAEFASIELRALLQQGGEAYFSRSLLNRIVFTVTPLQERLVADARERILLVMGASAFVLLLVCANVANLLLARTSARQRELALRGALGARRTRLARMLLTESLLLAVAGALVGLPIAWWLGEAARVLLAKHVPYVQAIAVDWRVATFALVAACVTGLLASLAALLRIRQINPAAALAGSARVSSRSTVGRATLLATEIAVAFMLVVGATLMLQTLWHLTTEARDFNTDSLITMRVSSNVETEFARNHGQHQQLTAAFFTELAQRIDALPGVASVAAASHLPLMGGGVGTSGISVAGSPTSEEAFAAFVPLTPGYFRTLGIPLAAGREFDDRDREGAPPVVIVNQAFMDLYAPGRALAGLQMRVDDWAPTIVGVARDTPVSLRDTPTPVIFAPLLQLAGRPFGFPALTIVVRARDGSDPTTLAALLQKEAWSTGPAVVVDRVGTMAGRVDDAVRVEHDLTVLLSLFGGVALLIAAIGVYGVAAYATVQRTSEIGIRMALGARRFEIARLILSQVMRPSIVGIIAGVAGAVTASRMIAASLFGVAAVDARTLAGAGAILLIAALAASWIPARRATAIDPLTAVRHE